MRTNNSFEQPACLKALFTRYSSHANATRVFAHTQVIAREDGRVQSIIACCAGEPLASMVLDHARSTGLQPPRRERIGATPRRSTPTRRRAQQRREHSLALHERLRLTGENGTNLTLSKQDLDPKRAVPFVKLNRQGTLRFRVFKKQGDTWQPGRNLRGLIAVEVLQ